MGKTTLSVNIAAAVANLGKKVLLIDSDPQCNLTSYLAESSLVDHLLDHSDKDDGRTIWSALKPIAEASGGLKRIEPYELPLSGAFLVPGDIRLSEFETELSDFWSQCLQRKSKGFKGTMALSRLVNRLSQRLNIDFVFYDSGPNIGPLNRVILLDCDYFIVPVACDLFSVRALTTLGRSLATWIQEWKTISALAPTDTYLLPGMPKFGGYIPQNFRVYGNQPARRHSQYLAKLEKHIHSDVVSILRSLDLNLVPIRGSQAKLGEVKDFATLVSASQTQGVPLAEVKGAPPHQKAQAQAVFGSIAKKLIDRTEADD